jgi:hypothetical protein
MSDASNLVAGDSNGYGDIFVKDLQSGAIQRVSTDAAGAQGNSDSDNASSPPTAAMWSSRATPATWWPATAMALMTSSSRTCRAGRSSACRPMPPGRRATVKATKPGSPPTAAAWFSRAIPATWWPATAIASPTSSSRTCRAGRSSAYRAMPPGYRATVSATTPGSPLTAARGLHERCQQSGGRRQQWLQ